MRPEDILALKNEPTIGGMVAKAFFAEAKNRSIIVSLMVPWWRFDFMNLIGYVIRVENIDIGNTGKKETIYGMLSSLVFSASSSGDGSVARMQLGLTHVRDSCTNDTYGMDDNPLYGIGGTADSMDGGTGVAVDNFTAAPAGANTGISQPRTSVLVTPNTVASDSSADTGISRPITVTAAQIAAAGGVQA